MWTDKHEEEGKKGTEQKTITMFCLLILHPITGSFAHHLLRTLKGLQLVKCLFKHTEKQSCNKQSAQRGGTDTIMLRREGTDSELLVSSGLKSSQPFLFTLVILELATVRLRLCDIWPTVAGETFQTKCPCV